jgi:hypothetical protein
MRRILSFAAMLVTLGVGIAVAQTTGEQSPTAQSRRAGELPVARPVAKSAPRVASDSSDPQEGGEVASATTGVRDRRTIGNRTYEGIRAPNTPTGVRDPRAVGGVIAATNSIRCGNTIYQVSVDDGGCDKVNDGFVLCNNASGHRATASCDSGCGDSRGSGSCTITAAPN